MANWFNFYTLIAFVLGVLLSGWVMSLFHKSRAAVSG